jgi:GNAT superfamily N-acetyltransferase
MYLIRPGAAADRDGVVAMIRARAGWLREHGHDRWASWARSAETLGDQVGDPEWPVWVLTSGAGRVVGCTTAATDTPRLAWTEQERAEPAVFLQSTVTHPDLAGRGVGVLIAFWALDHAARHGRRWVRRGVLTLGPANRGLVRYYRWQGWRVVRVIPHPRKDNVLVWSLQRPAAPQPDLAGILAEAPAPTGALPAPLPPF